MFQGVNKLRSEREEEPLETVEGLVLDPGVFNDLVLAARMVGELDEEVKAASNIQKLAATLEELCNAVKAKSNSMTDDSEVRTTSGKNVKFVKM